MHARHLRIPILVIQMAASTFLVPATLVASMLTLPTTCQCGADKPHPHALFQLAGHSHEPSSTTTTRDEREVVSSGQDGVTVQASTGGAAPQTLAVMHDSGLSQLNLPRLAASGVTTRLPSGQYTIPDIPPPRDARFTQP